MLADTLFRSLEASGRVVFTRAALPDEGPGLEEALNQLMAEGRIVPLGEGFFARARPGRLPGRGPVPDAGFSEVIRQVAELLGRTVLESEEVRRYNARLSTQLPTGRYQLLSGPPMRLELIIGRGKVVLEARGDAAPTGDG